jgi:hypothetical protein
MGVVTRAEDIGAGHFFQVFGFSGVQGLRTLGQGQRSVAWAWAAL